MNPWAVEPVVITSIDFVKQPEVLRALCSPDLGPADRGRSASGRSAPRCDTRRSRPSRAARVTSCCSPPLPTPATMRAYRALCALGQIRPARTRFCSSAARSEQAALPANAARAPARGPARLRTRSKCTACSMAYRRAALADWPRHRQARRSVGRDGPSKRAFSSARSLAARSNGASRPYRVSAEAPSQPALPFDVDTDPADEAPLPHAPAFDRVDEEARRLRRLIDAARRAQRNDRKMQRARADPAAGAGAGHRVHRVSRHARRDCSRASAACRTRRRLTADRRRRNGARPSTRSRAARPTSCSPPMRAPKA